MALYAGATALLTIVNIAQRPDLSLAENWFSIATAVQYFLFFYCAFVFGQKCRIESWVKTTIAVCCIVAVVSLLQFLGIGSVRSIIATYTGNEMLEDLIWNGTYRGTGLFPSWHTLEMYLAIALVITMSLLGRMQLTVGRRTVLLVATGTMAIGMACGLTLTPVLLVVAAFVFYMRTGRMGRYLLPVAGAIVVALLTTPLLPMIDDRLTSQAVTVADLPPWLPQTIAYRLYQWQTSLFPVIGQNLLTGYGPINDGANTGVFQFTESQYVNVLVLGGIPLLIIFLGLMWKLVDRMRRVSALWPPSSPEGAIASAGLVVAVGICFLQLVHPYLQDSAGAGMFFGLMGIVSGVGARPIITDASAAGATKENGKKQ